jgi:hypothetical protein
MIGGEHWGEPEAKGFNQALGRSVKFFVVNDILPMPLELAKKRNGQPYKSSNRLYVTADTVYVEPRPVMKIPAARLARNREVLSNVDWTALQQPTLTIYKEQPMFARQLIHITQKEQYRAGG